MMRKFRERLSYALLCVGGEDACAEEFARHMCT